MLIRTDLPGCCLRPWKQEDKAALVRNANNRKVWRNLTEMFPHPYTEADAEHWLSIANELSPSIHLAIEVEGSAVGGVGVIAGEGIARHTGQFGYWLGEAHWGKGIATAAARAMAAHAFTGPQFMRLEAPVFEWNPPSMRVLEKVGFVREGILKRSVFKDGQLIDSVMYAHTRDA
ncbi:MAG: N-acetyltransferase [Betaproteobacteria bacterium]|nr:N-acetyltransferase [Betaproteobacteria bacterium]